MAANDSGDLSAAKDFADLIDRVAVPGISNVFFVLVNSGDAWAIVYQIGHHGNAVKWAILMYSDGISICLGTANETKMDDDWIGVTANAPGDV